jgi:hypothetical protein
MDWDYQMYERFRNDYARLISECKNQTAFAMKKFLMEKIPKVLH